MKTTRVKALQFLFFATYGTAVPFFGIYYRDLLRTASGDPDYAAVGTVLSVSMLVGIASPLVAGYLADRFRIHNRLITLLALLVFLGSIALFLPGTPLFSSVPPSATFAVVLAGAVITGLFVRPIIPLIDTETLIVLRERDGGIERYGEVRVFGSIGWVVTATAVGLVVTRVGDLSFMIVCYGIGFVALAAVGRTGFRSEIRRIRIPWSHFAKDRPFRRFLLFVFLFSVGTTGGYVYTGVYMADLGLSFGVIGIAYAFAALPEVPVLLRGRRFLARIGNHGMISIGSTFQVAKFALLYLIAGTGLPWLFILVMMLQGAGFSMQFAGMVDYMDRRAHEHLRATYQSLYHIATALGGAAGNFAASLGAGLFPSRTVMLASAVMVAVSVCYFLAFVPRSTATVLPALEG